MIIPKIRIGKYKVLDGSTSRLIWLFVFLLTLIVSFLKEDIFPQKYFLDSNKIFNLIKRDIIDLSDPAFGYTAITYRLLGLTDKEVIIPIVGCLLFWLMILRVCREFNLVSIRSFIVIIFFSVMAMVYLTTYSKDLLVLIFLVVPFLSMRKNKKGILIWIILAILYAYLFRSYWFIVVGLYLLFYTILPLIKKIYLLIPIAFMIYLVLAIVFNSQMNISLNNYREVVNVDRVGIKEAESMIISVFKDDNVIVQALDAFIILMYLFVPVPLILSSKIYYIVISIFITLNSFVFFRTLFLIEKGDKNQYLKACTSLILAFVIVQSIFEPDYGSYVRHLAPFYPVFFYLHFYINNLQPNKSKRVLNKA